MVLNTNWQGISNPAPAGMFVDSALRAPMFGHQAPTRQSMFQPADESQQLFGMIANALAPTLLGMTPGEMAVSQFNPTHSMFTRMQQAERTAALTEARKTARRHDTDGRVFTGIRQMMTGKKASTAERMEDRQIAEMMNDYGVPVARALGVSDDMIDSFYGRRGSAGMFLNQVEKAYANKVDPVTGQVGYSGKSLAATSDRLFDKLYGPNANLNEMNGLSARQAGEMINEMHSRGMMGKSSASMSLQEKRAALDSNMSDKEIQRIADNLDESKKAKTEDRYDDAAAKKAFESVKSTYRVLKDPTLKRTQKEINDMTGSSDLLLTVNADMAINKVKSMSGAVAALRKVFGDNGNPNAPMSQIFDGLNKLSNNSTQSIRDDVLSDSVRRMEAVGRQSGRGFEAVVQDSNDMGAIMASIGVDPRNAVKLASSGTSGGGIATAANGAGMTDLKVRGTQSVEQLQSVGNGRVVAAMASDGVNSLGIARRLVDEGLIAEDKQGGIKAMLDAAKAGNTTFTYDGKQYDTAMKDADFAAFATKTSGISSAQLNTLARDRQANQDLVTDKEVDTILASQSSEIAKDKMMRPLQETLLQGIGDDNRKTLDDKGMSPRAIEEKTAKILAKKAASSMPTDVMKDPKKKNAWLAEAEKEARLEAARSVLGDDAKAEEYASTVESGMDNSESGKSRRGATISATIDKSLEDTAYGNLTGLQQHTHDSVIRQSRLDKINSRVEATLNGKLEGLAQQNPIRRAIDAMANAGPDADLLQVAKSTLGVTDFNRLVGEGAMQKMEEQAKLRRELVEMGATATNEQLQEKEDQLVASAEAINKELMDYDYATDNSKGGRRRDLNRISDESRQGKESLAKLVSEGSLSKDEEKLLERRFVASSVSRDKILNEDHMVEALGKDEVDKQLKLREKAAEIETIRAQTESELGRPVTNVELIKMGKVSARDFESVMDFDSANEIVTNQHLEDKGADPHVRKPGDLATAYSAARSRPGDTMQNLRDNTPEPYKGLFANAEGDPTVMGEMVNTLDNLDNAVATDSVGGLGYLEKHHQAVRDKKEAARKLMTEHGVSEDEQEDILGEVDAHIKSQRIAMAKELVKKSSDGQRLNKQEEDFLADTLASTGGLNEAAVKRARKRGEQGNMSAVISEVGGVDGFQKMLDNAQKSRGNKTDEEDQFLAYSNILTKMRDGKNLSKEEVDTLRQSAMMLPPEERDKVDAMFESYDKAERTRSDASGTALEKVEGVEDLEHSLKMRTAEIINRPGKASQQDRWDRSTMLGATEAIGKLRQGESLSREEQGQLKNAIKLMPESERKKYSKFTEALDEDMKKDKSDFQKDLEANVDVEKTLTEAEKEVLTPIEERGKSKVISEVSPLTDTQKKILEIQRKANNLTPEEELAMIKDIGKEDGQLRDEENQKRIADKLSTAGKTDDLYMGYESQKELEKLAVKKGLFGDTKIEDLTSEQRSSVGDLLADDEEAAGYLSHAERYRRSTSKGSEVVEGLTREYLGKEDANAARDKVPETGTAGGGGEIKLTGGNITVDLTDKTGHFNLTGSRTNQAMYNRNGVTN